MCQWLWRQHQSTADLPVRRVHQCVQKRSWQQSVGMFPTWSEDKSENSKRPGSGFPRFSFSDPETLVFAARSWLATGTCHWWGNLTPLWWGVGFSSACDERVWDDSRSWAAAERWWWGPEPAGGLHLQRETAEHDIKKHKRAHKSWGMMQYNWYSTKLFNYLTLVLDVLPLLQMVWRWGCHSVVGSGRL